MYYTVELDTLDYHTLEFQRFLLLEGIDSKKTYLMENGTETYQYESETLGPLVVLIAEYFAEDLASFLFLAGTIEEHSC